MNKITALSLDMSVDALLLAALYVTQERPSRMRVCIGKTAYHILKDIGSRYSERGILGVTKAERAIEVRDSRGTVLVAMNLP